MLAYLCIDLDENPCSDVARYLEKSTEATLKCKKFKSLLSHQLMVEIKNWEVASPCAPLARLGQMVHMLVYGDESRLDCLISLLNLLSSIHVDIAKKVMANRQFPRDLRFHVLQVKFDIAIAQREYLDAESICFEMLNSSLHSRHQKIRADLNFVNLLFLQNRRSEAYAHATKLLSDSNIQFRGKLQIREVLKNNKLSFATSNDS